jgi:hypothetical protein
MKDSHELTEREPHHLRESFYASHPGRFTVFLRTFLPWQLLRFAVINMRMLRIIARSHR